MQLFSLLTGFVVFWFGVPVLPSEPDDDCSGCPSGERSVDADLLTYMAAHGNIRPHVEGLAQQQGMNGGFEQFRPIRYTTQVVAGLKYFVKVQMSSDSYMDVAIYQSFQETAHAQIVGVKFGVDRDAAITMSYPSSGLVTTEFV